MKLKPEYLVAIILLIFTISFFAANHIIVYYTKNSPYPQEPDKSCIKDSDCKLWVHPGWSSCHFCDPCVSREVNDNDVIAINNNWEPFCPENPPKGLACLACASSLTNINSTVILRCINNQCVKIIE
jgi:hypothetical protein